MFTETQPSLEARFLVEGLRLRRLNAAITQLARRRMQYAADGDEGGLAAAKLTGLILERDIAAARARIDALLDDATATAGRDGGT